MEQAKKSIVANGLFEKGMHYYIEENFEKAFEHFKEAAELDYPDAICYQGKCHYYGYGVKEDYFVAFELFEKAAKLNSVEAMYYLGKCYYLGNGTKNNMDRAFSLFSRAMKMGQKEVTAWLELCFEYGHGVDQDLNQALYFAKINFNRYQVEKIETKISQVKVVPKKKKS